MGRSRKGEPAYTEPVTFLLSYAGMATSFNGLPGSGIQDWKRSCRPRQFARNLRVYEYCTVT